jgi:CheY-like chemotaxis protein
VDVPPGRLRRDHAPGGFVVPKTLLVVDDSATMRKVFEMTLAGEDLAVVTHDGGESLLARARDARPSLAIVDVGLGDKTGYDVVRQLKGDPLLGGVSVFLLYSEHSPMDEARAREAGADGSLLKPFDTQAAIDKIKQALSQAPGAAAPAPLGVTAPVAAAASAPLPPPPGASAPRPATTAGAAVPLPASPAGVRAPSAAGVGAVGTASAAASRPKATQMFVSSPLPPPPVASPPPVAAPPSFAAPRPASPFAPPSVARAPEPARHDSADIEIEVDGSEEVSLEPAAPAKAPAPVVAPAPFVAPSAVRPPVAAASATVATPAPAPASVSALNAEVQQRVNALGLTAAQAEAVTALTREVVERVVWEVVPQLAETLIREEIRRLTAE